MVRIYSWLIYSLITVIFGVDCQAQHVSAITSGELKAHVEYLASQELGGRYPGTAGDREAAEYIRNAFSNYGLKLHEGSGFQPFQVTTGIRKGSGNTLVLKGSTGVADRDFVPLSISDNGRAEGPVVYLGYGLRIKTDSLQWDDFSGMNIKGKIGLILLGAPEPANGTTHDPFAEFGSVRSKLLAARDAGALAVILVAGPGYDAQDDLDFGTVRENSAGLPVIRIKRAFLDEAVQSIGFSTGTEESYLNKNYHPNSRELGINASLQTDLVTESASTQNVIAFVEASKPTDDNEWIVVGAHYDHLGMGGQGSSSRIQDTVGVHPGADDNASGVASIIEMAGYLHSVKNKLSRSVLFVAFTGEELGLLGSRYFVENPPVPLKNIVAMINLDMVGRPNTEKRLSISGLGTSDGMDSLLNLTNPGNLQFAKSPEGYGPSDHASFYFADIPILYFSTGAHLDYHTPADTPDKLDYNNMSDIVSIISNITLTLSNAKSGLNFKKAGTQAADSGRRKLKVTLGIMPDVSGTTNDGLRVEFATPGKPAQLAGITKGDRITAINGMPVTNVYDYMTRLQTLKSGQIITVELVRGVEKMLVLVQL